MMSQRADVALPDHRVLGRALAEIEKRVGAKVVDGAQCWVSKADRAGEHGRIAFPSILGIELVVMPDVQDEGRLTEERCVDQAGPYGVDATLERSQSGT